MSMRGRLVEQQRLLGAIEWPRWALHGIPAVVVVIGAVAIWEHTIHGPHSTDPPASTLPAALLIGLSVMPWVIDWARHMMRPNLGSDGTGLAFAAVAIAPLAVVHVGGRRLGVADVSGDAPQVSLMILLVIGCVVATCSPAPVVFVVEAAVLAVIVGRALQSDRPQTWTIWIIAAVVVACGGLAMRAIFIAMQRLQALQDEQAKRAVADERRRVAREVRDTVAHTLSVTMLHLTAARLAVERAPDRAIAALEEAERQGRAGMGDLRRMVHLLRVDDDPNPDAPVDDDRLPSASPSHLSPTIERALPTAAELPALIDRYAAAGLTITVEGVQPEHSRIDPAIGDVPPAVGLTLYRVAQESLTNAARHGCGDARIRVVVDAEHATLTVHNHCREHAPTEQVGGMGLVGMRERVVGLGGRFSAGPVANGNGSGNGTGRGTWLVEAHLPIAPVGPAA